MIVYFGEEVERALTDYLELQRNGITPLSGHEDALFLSGQKKRISVDAVEKMVKKYCSAVSVKLSLHISFVVLMVLPLSGNRGYLSCGRRTWTRRCEYDEKALCQIK